MCGSDRFRGRVGMRDKSQDDAKFRVLRLLEQNPELSQRDLARALGISTGSTHYVLKALIKKGMVKLGNFTASDDKRRYAYVLTPKGIAERATLTRRFLARKMIEYEALKAEIEEIYGELSEADSVSLKMSVRDK